jgi:uncharacterized membrane protein
MHSTVHPSAETTAHLSSPAPRLGLASQPVYATLAQFPAVCFTGTLLTDIMYEQTKLFMWNNFSAWLLTAGCIMAAFAGIAGLVTWIKQPHVRKPRFAGLHAICVLVALALSIVNAFVHSRDAHAIMPEGLVLSAIVFVLMLLATWLGWPRPTADGALGAYTEGAL